MNAKGGINFDGIFFTSSDADMSLGALISSMPPRYLLVARRPDCQPRSHSHRSTYIRCTLLVHSAIHLHRVDDVEHVLVRIRGITCCGWPLYFEMACHKDDIIPNKLTLSTFRLASSIWLVSICSNERCYDIPTFYSQRNQ